MVGIVQIDMTEIAEKLSGQKVSHVHSCLVSPQKRAHGYALSDQEPDGLTGDEKDMEHADLIILLDGGGGYDAFMENDVKGFEMLHGTPFAQGHISDLMKDPGDEGPGL